MFLLNLKLIFLHTYLQLLPDHELSMDIFHSLCLKLKSKPSSHLPYPSLSWLCHLGKSYMYSTHPCSAGQHSSLCHPSPTWAQFITNSYQQLLYDFLNSAWLRYILQGQTPANRGDRVYLLDAGWFMGQETTALIFTGLPDRCSGGENQDDVNSTEGGIKLFWVDRGIMETWWQARFKGIICRQAQSPDLFRILQVLSVPLWMKPRRDLIWEKWRGSLFLRGRNRGRWVVEQWLDFVGLWDLERVR